MDFNDVDIIYILLGTALLTYLAVWQISVISLFIPARPLLPPYLKRCYRIMWIVLMLVVGRIEKLLDDNEDIGLDNLSKVNDGIKTEVKDEGRGKEGKCKRVVVTLENGVSFTRPMNHYDVVNLSKMGAKIREID